MKKLFRALLLVLTVSMNLSLAPIAAQAAPSAGSLIKRADHPAVYYYATDGKRYVFPNERVFKTWYADFSSVQTVTADELAAIQIGGNVTYRPGFRMIKIDTDPKVYAVSRGGVLRHVASEASAAAIFGSGWAKLVDDIPDAFFVNYAMGAPIVSASDFDRDAELASATNINADKGMTSVPTPTPPPAPPSGASDPASTPTSSTPADTASGYENVDLITDNGFEASAGGFAPAYASDGSAQQTSTDPIEGAKSLRVVNNAYGRVSFGKEYPWEAGPYAKSLTARAKIRVESASPSGGEVQICVIAYRQSDGAMLSKCGEYPVGSGVVQAEQTLEFGDAQVNRAYFQFKLDGDGTIATTVDDAHFIVVQKEGVAVPDSGSGSDSGSSGSDSGSGSGTSGDANQTPSAGTIYPGFTYHLPANRPFISLQDYAHAVPGTSAYDRFKSYVDAAVDGHPDYGYTPADAVIMYALTGEAKYIDHAISEVEAFVASEESRAASGCSLEASGDSYLEVGPFIEEVALTYDRGYAKLSSSQRARWEAYMEQAVTNVWDPANARWGGRSCPWSGWSINNPGNNYFFSFMKATQLWALASKSSKWLTFLQTYKFPLLADYYAKIPGGGSREGSGYGTAQKNLFENYRMWKASTGEDLAALSTHERDTIDYWVYATVPTLDRFAPIGDQSRVSEPELYDYHENLVREAVMNSPGTAQAKRGVWWLDRNTVTSLSGFNRRGGLLIPSDTAQIPSALTYHATGVGQFFARSSWDTDASWLQVTAGPYDESHAHQDQGGFAFYKGAWLAVTSNIWSHSGIHQEVGAQNVLRFSKNGSVIGQNESVSTMTPSTSGGVTSVHADLTNAYSRHSGDVQSWTRDFRYEGNTLNVHDICRAASGVSAVFQLHVPVKPTLQSDGSIKAGNLLVTPRQAVSVKLVEMRTVDGDFNSGWRIELTNASGCEYSVDLTAL